MQLLNPNRDLDFSVRDVNIDFFNRYLTRGLESWHRMVTGRTPLPMTLLRNWVLFPLLLFQWMNDVMKTGNKRALEEGDFVPLSKENTSQSATELLNKKWKEELAKSIGKKKHRSCGKLL